MNGHRFSDQHLVSSFKRHGPSSITDSRGIKQEPLNPKSFDPSILASSILSSKEPSSNTHRPLNNSSPPGTLSSIQVTPTTSFPSLSDGKFHNEYHQSSSSTDASRKQQSNNQILVQDVRKFKEQVVKDLKRWEFESTNILYHPQSRSNKYNVKHTKRLTGIFDPNPDNFCTVKLATIDGSFPGIVSKGVYASLTGQSLENAIKERILAKLEPNNSSQNKRLLSSSLNCGLVTNSGALKGSNNGNDIDHNDLIVRFNDAPTGLSLSSSDKEGKGSELLNDLGTISDIRIINSKVLSDQKFNISSPIFKNQIIIVWDPYQFMSFDPSFDMNLLGEHPRMDHDFYESFIKIKESDPYIKMYILDPRTVWDSWKLLQESTQRRIPKTPPSSGFLGLVVLSKFCSTITMYEYIPSIRITDQCHYYDTANEGASLHTNKNTGGVGPGCTFGDWHPLSSEKLFTLRLNYASDSDVFIGGRAKLAGCSNGWPQNLIKSFNMWSSS